LDEEKMGQGKSVESEELIWNEHELKAIFRDLTMAAIAVQGCVNGTYYVWQAVSMPACGNGFIAWGSFPCGRLHANKILPTLQ
jgi:hypothetical protein